MRAAEGRAPAWWHKLLFAWIILQLAAMSLVWNLVAPLLGLLLPRHTAGVVGRGAVALIYRSAWASACWLGLMRIDATALDALGAEPGGLVIAANHPTMLDALIVVAHLPRGVCVMKADLLKNIFLGAGARLAQYIRADSGRGMLRAAVATLREGNQLVLFPEGTRTVTRPINAFKPGVTLIAHLAQVPIQTVLIDSESPYLGKGWPILRVPSFPVVVKVRLGRRFAPEADHQGLLKRIEAYFAEELRR